MYIIYNTQPVCRFISLVSCKVSCWLHGFMIDKSLKFPWSALSTDERFLKLCILDPTKYGDVYVLAGVASDGINRIWSCVVEMWSLVPPYKISSITSSQWSKVEFEQLRLWGLSGHARCSYTTYRRSGHWYHRGYWGFL